MSSHDLRCRICGNGSMLENLVAAESMFGTWEEFTYAHCLNCGCLQICDIPDNLGSYYPDQYYSFEGKIEYPKNLFRRGKAMLATRLALQGKSSLLSVLGKAMRPPEFVLNWLAPLEVNRNSAIVDLGCGNGELLHRMAWAGFRNLMGVDAFLPKTDFKTTSVRLFRGEISDVNEKFDAVMCHHALEHMVDQENSLRAMMTLLKPTGRMLLRIPVLGKAFALYRESWIQLDAPRHLYLHSLKSISLLADRIGLKVESVVYDSTAFQFWGSEQAKRRIALQSPESFAVNPDKSLFTDANIRHFSKEAERLNHSRDGDQVVLILVLA